MGVVTAVRTTMPDGTVTEASPEPAPHQSAELLEYLYAYGPDSLPTPGAAEASMWRYRDLLPIGDGPIRFPLPVGWTPLIHAPRLQRDLGLPRLVLKDETRGPTGSNKDRATALVLEQALRDGTPTVSCASTGNVAVSLAVGAAAAGVNAVVFIPPEIAPLKLRLLLSAGATVFQVSDGYSRAFELSRSAAAAFGWVDRNTGVNPLTLEAKKTAAFEIWEQLGRRLPDVVVVPVGDGVTLSAMAKGFEELRSTGVSHVTPRIIGVQSEGCQPIVSAWELGHDVAAVTPHTIADGIAVGRPVLAAATLRWVGSSKGALLAVTDQSILEAASMLMTRAGIMAEPAGATALAGAIAAVARGLVDRGECIVAHVTGSALKTPQYLPATANTPKIVSSLDDLPQHLPGAESVG